MKTMKDLSKGEIKILELMYENTKNRPKEYNLSEIENYYKKLDYTEFPDDNLNEMISNLIQKEYIENTKDKKYKIINHKFNDIKMYFKKINMINNLKSFGSFIFVFFVLGFILFNYNDYITNFLDDIRSKSDANIILRDNNVKKKINELIYENQNLYKQEDDLKNNNNDVYNKINEEKPITNQTKNQKNKIQNKLKKSVLLTNSQKIDSLMIKIRNLELLINKDPAYITKLTNISNELTLLKENQNVRYESMTREIENISSYNNTLIIFMITFIVSFVAIIIWVVKKGNNP